MSVSRFLSLLLLLALVAAYPPPTAHADASLRLTYMEVRGADLATYPVADGGIIDRAAESLRLRFSHTLRMPVLASWFAVTDSQGQDAGWVVERTSGYSDSVDLEVPGPLPAGETYTVLIRGGPDGLRDRNGNYLESDLTVTVQTETQFHHVTTFLWTDFGRAEAEPDALVDRGLSSAYFQFSTGVDPDSLAGNFTVTSASGESLTWQAMGQGYLMLFNQNVLQSGETYTITIRGGEDGIRSLLGDTLAADVTFPFTTEERPTEVSHMRYTRYSELGVPLTDGVIPRDTNEVEIFLNRAINRNTVARSVSVTDSQGQPVNWQVQSYELQPIKLVIPDNGYLAGRALPKNETYTVRIRGGEDGLLSRAGVPLPEDMLITLRTDDQPVRLRTFLGWYGAESQLGQTDIYELQAEAGPLRVTMTVVEGSSPVELLVIDDAAGTPLLQEWHWSGHVSETVTLPGPGTYYLIFSPNRVQQPAVEAMDLQVSPVMPGIQLPTMARFETRNEPFTFQPVLLDPAKADAVAIALNDTLLVENGLRADGTVEPVAVDPTTMDDGLYELAVAASGRENGNLALHARTFMVDRVDAFSDVPTWHWARRPVEFMAHLGILNGRGEGLFVPADPVTRAEFAKMLALTLGLKAEGSEPAPFADVGGEHWAHPYVAAVYEAGLMQGELVDGQRFFHPNRQITRAEAATVIGRALGVADWEVPGGPPPFADFDAVPEWARPSVYALAELGWINGFPDGYYYPQQTLQRDQSARVLSNFYGLE